jgi:hypothetical protein
LSSVGVRSLDRESVIAALREVASRMGDFHGDVREVRLFGSLARGGRNPWADADLLVVVDRSGIPFRDRTPRYRPVECPVPLDLMVVTADELARETDAGNRFLARILEESIVLFERGDRSAPSDPSDPDPVSSTTPRVARG